MIYFTSDLHLGHSAIINLSQRPFKSIEAMNETLINNYNSIVKNNDTVYILGDITYRTKIDNANKLIAQLKGKKYLIKGNHDNKKYDPSLFMGIYDYLEVNFYHTQLILMHYPLLEWNKYYRGAIHLHGHIHSIGQDYNLDCKNNQIRRYDVGVDANNFYPVSFKEIVDFMEINTKL